MKHIKHRTIAEIKGNIQFWRLSGENHVDGCLGGKLLTRLLDYYSSLGNTIQKHGNNPNKYSES